MSKVALVVIYNHQYNKNIEIVEKIYKNKFKDIHHLIPFYNGERPNVIPVYECSYYFQGYISQGLKKFFNEKYEHYFFVADDLILNPQINEKNYTEILKLNANSSFIPGFIELHKTSKWWARVGEAYHWNLKVDGIEAQNQLPDYEEALIKFNQFGLSLKPLKFSQIWKIPNSIRDFVHIVLKDQSFLFRYIKCKVFGKSYNISYPLVGSYSDICVVSAEDIKQFCHYCGVFAATRLFVEIALPTALVLSAKKIITENELDFQGMALWNNNDYKELEKYQKSLKKLLENFPDTILYFHPIKLSKWNAEL